jgi:hypothetical protein
VSQQINLFNPLLLHQKKYFSVLAMLQALVLIVLGSALFYAYAVYQVRMLAAQSQETSKRYADAQARLARNSAEFSPQQARQLLDNEVKKAEAQLVAQRELIDTLKSGAIGNTSGYSEYMRAFARQTMNGLWLTGFDITGDAVQMSMRGGALSPELVPGYIKRLSQEKIMRGREFASLQIQQHKFETGEPSGRPYLEFTLQSEEVKGAKK